MKKSLQALIITGLLLTVFGTMCGCQSTVQTSQSSSDIIQSSEVEVASNSGKSETKLDIYEEKMPALDIKQTAAVMSNLHFTVLRKYPNWDCFRRNLKILLRNHALKKNFRSL